MRVPFWEYFIALEDDLIRIGRYVEFAPDNMKTFSIELARVLLSCSSEVDVIAKELCKTVDPSANPGNINEYREIVTAKFPLFHTYEISFPRHNFAVQPWKEWGMGKNPSWWKSYNNVKHKRADFFHEANLENAIGSVTGLFCLLLYYYKAGGQNLSEINPWPKLLEPKDYTVSGWQQASISWSFNTPDHPS